MLDTPETVAEFWDITRDPEFGWDPEEVARRSHGDRAAAPRPPPVRRALLAARQDRLRDGRRGELAREVLGGRRGDGVDADAPGRGRRRPRRVVLRDHARGARAPRPVRGARAPAADRDHGVRLPRRGRDGDRVVAFPPSDGPSRSRSTATAGSPSWRRRCPGATWTGIGKVAPGQRMHPPDVSTQVRANGAIRGGQRARATARACEDAAHVRDGRPRARPHRRAARGRGRGPGRLAGMGGVRPRRPGNRAASRSTSGARWPSGPACPARSSASRARAR